MGQIIGSAAKPKRCNLNKLSQLGILAAGEHVLVSYDNSMNAAGQGNFDRYIVGDGRTAATALELKYLDDSTRPYIVEEVNRAVADIQPIEITGDVTNAPDEEDLTSENQGGTDVLKFKDKAYNSALYSGLGRTYLRKNIVTLEGTGKNVLTQAMVNTANTIYHIQYDYDLGEDITMPAGCVLEFDGGSINGSDDNVLNLSNTTKIVGVGLNCYISNVIISNETQHLSSYLKDVSDSSKNTNVLQALADSTSPVCIDKSITCDSQISVQNLVLFGDNNATITFPNSDGFVWKGGISNKDNISSINVISYGHCFNFDGTPRPTLYRARINNIKATSRNGNCFHAGSNANSHCFEMSFVNIYVIAPNGCGFTGFNAVGFVYENIASGYCGIATFLNCNGLWLSYNGCFYDDGTTNTATPTFYKVDSDTSNTNLICEFVNCNFEGFKEAIFDAKGFGTYTFINCVFDQLQVEYDGFPLKMMGDIRKIYFSNILIRWSHTSPSDKIFLGIVNHSTQQVISDTTIKVKSSNGNIVLTYGYEIGLKTALDDKFLERMPCVNSNYSFSARMLETSLIRPVWQDCDIDQTNGIIYPRDSNFISINNSVTSIGRIGNMSKRNQFVFIRNDSDHDITFTHRSWGQFIVTNTGQNIVLKSGEVMRGYIKNIASGSNRLYLWSPINDDNFAQNLC